MNQKKNIERLNDLWLRIFGIPLVSLATTFTFSANIWMEDHSLFWKPFFVSVVGAVFVCETGRFILIRVAERFPGLELASQRHFASHLLYLPACIIVTEFILLGVGPAIFCDFPVGLYDDV